MKTKSYDRRIQRFLKILNDLGSRRLVVPKDLAEEFNVNVRTIQRDLSLLEVAGFPIDKNHKTGSYHFVDGFNLGKSQLNEKEWAIILSMSDMAKKLGPPFDGLMGSIINKNLHPSAPCDWLYFKTDEPARLDGLEDLLDGLVDGIRNKKIVTFNYRLSGEYQVEAEPYKIAHFHGFWYLVAKDTSDDKIKTYALDKIKDVKPTGRFYKQIPENLKDVLDGSFNIWFGDGKKKKVVVEVDASVAEHFKRKKWFPNQEVVEEKENGNLVIAYWVTDYMEILPFVKSWIPNVWVVRSSELKKRIKRELIDGIEKLANS